jgi:hypothetical protein
MADQGPPVERLVKAVSVSTRTFPGNDGKEKSVHKGVFEFEQDGKKHLVKADSWSGECAKVIEENIGKMLLVSVVDTGRVFQEAPVFDITKIRSGDGKTELYSGGQTKRGGQRGSYSQRPDWSYEDKEEREARARSIEAQVAAKAATWYFGYLIQFGDHEDEATKELLTVAGALEFHKKMTAEIRHGIRIAAQVRSSSSAPKSGPGVAERPSPDPGNRTRGSEPLASAADGEAPTEAPLLSPRGEQGEGTLASGPDSDAELIAARNAAIEVFKTPRSVEKAFAMGNDGQLIKFSDMTAEQLAGLAASPPSGSQQTEPEAAGMAGGW